MKFTWIVVFLFFSITNSQAAITFESSNGDLVPGPTGMIEACAQTRTIHITSALSSAYSNISSASMHSCSAPIVIHNGGSINNTTTFRVNGPITAGPASFGGTGAVIFNTDINHPEGWFSSGKPVTFNAKLVAGVAKISSALVIGSATKTEYLLPQWWGAKGNGSTDDSAALTAAINTAVSTGLPVKFVPGTYPTTSTVTLNNRLTMIGENPQTTIIKFTGTGDFLSGANLNGIGFAEKHIIRGIRFNGVDNKQSRTAIHLRNNHILAHIYDCVFENFDTAIYMEGQAYGNMIDTSTFNYIKSYAIRSTGNAEQFTILHNILNQSDTSTATGIYVESATSGTIQDNIIQHFNYGVQLVGCKPVEARGNHFEGITTASFLVKPSSSYQSEANIISGSYMNGGLYGIAIDWDVSSGRKVYGLTLQNNTFTGQTLGAIAGVNGSAPASATINLILLNNSWHNTYNPGAVPLILNLTSAFESEHDYPNVLRFYVQNHRIMYGTAAPTSGTFVKGDYMINQNKTVGQPKGWFCTVSGTPGTWVSEGNL